MTEHSKAARAAVIVMVATLCSKILGFIREMVLGAKFGATVETDAYLVSITIPAILFASITSAVSTTFIPVYTQIGNDHGSEKANNFSSNILNITLLFSGILAFLGVIFTKPIVSLIAIGFDEQALSLAVRLTRITLFMMVFIGGASVFKGFLESNRKFTFPAMVGIPYNIAIIASLFISHKTGIVGVAIGTLIGAVLQMVIQMPGVFKTGYKYNFLTDLSDKYIRKVGVLIVPVVMGTAVAQINALVDRMLASGLAEGSISALNFANRLSGFIFGLFSMSISTVIYPLLARYTAEKDLQSFKRVFVSAVNVMSLIIIPVSVGAIMLRVPIVRVLFERGAFDERATLMTATALFFYSIGMLGFGLRDVLGRVFFSLHDTKTPMINGAAAMMLNIALNLILVRFMGLGGLALATSVSAIIGTILLFYSLRKKIGGIDGRNIITVFVKCMAASALMGAVVNFVYRVLNSNFMILPLGEVVSLLITVLAGVFIYAVCILLLNIKEIHWFIGIVRETFIRKKPV